MDRAASLVILLVAFELSIIHALYRGDNKWPARGNYEFR